MASPEAIARLLASRKGNFSRGAGNDPRGDQYPSGEQDPRPFEGAGPFNVLPTEPSPPQFQMDDFVNTGQGQLVDPVGRPFLGAGDVTRFGQGTSCRTGYVSNVIPTWARGK